MSEQLEIAELEREGAQLLVIRGELDVASAPGFADRLAMLLAEHSTIELDLSGLTFIDSTGLGVLVRATTAAADAGGDLTIVAVSEQMLRVVELTGLSATLHLATRHD